MNAKKRLAIWNADIIWCHAKNILTNYSVVTADDKIIDVLPTDAAKNKYSKSIVYEFEKSIIVPGFIDCHSHFELTSLHEFYRYSNLFELMIASGQWHRNSSLDDIVKSCRVGQQKSINNGIVYSVDWVSCLFKKERYVNSKIVLPMLEIIDPLGIKYSSQKLYCDFDEYGLAPHSLYMVDMKTLSKAFAYANKLISMHIAEDSSETLWINKHCGSLFEHCKKESSISCINKYYTNFFDLLSDSFCASPGVIYVHGVNLTDCDLDTIKAQKSYLCLCPESNLALTGETVDFNKIIKKHIDFLLGTDSYGANYDIISNAQILLSRTDCDKYFLANKILNALTKTAAKAIGLENCLGSVEIGKNATFLIMSYNNPSKSKDVVAYNIITSGKIKKIIIDGEVIY
ncbi:MAG: amidohydrolase family protein [Lactobacillales bacterium]|jgi:5-methylthioadenosine/S-adenosylhomocysteine deaminase|nr:amidohydrolase family protein [Lactobacillales bacterium]